MSKITIKYIAIYIGIYIAVLLIQGFINFLALCQGELYKCVYDHKTVITTVQTTAYILAPLVVILGLNTWIKQHTVTINHELLKEALKAIDQLTLYHQYMYRVFYTHKRSLSTTWKDAESISAMTPGFNEFKNTLFKKRREEYLEYINYLKLQFPVIKLFFKENNLDQIEIKDSNFINMHDDLLHAIKEDNVKLYLEYSENLDQKYNEIYQELHSLKGKILDELYIE